MHNNHLWQAIGIAVLIVTLFVVIGIYAYQFTAQLTGETLPTQAMPLSSAQVTPETVTTSTNQPILTPKPRQTEPQMGGTFVQAVDSVTDQLNPVLTTNQTTQAIAHKIYPVLLGLDPQSGHIAPTELATSWQVSQGGLQYTFTLREDIFWSDGIPVTANDFKFTYDAMRNGTVDSPFREMTAPISGIEALNPHLLAITLNEPNCATFHLLRQPLLPSHRYQSNFSDLQSNPLNREPVVGAGPFLFKAQIPNERILLTRNSAYWKGSPYLEEWAYHLIPDPQERFQRLTGGDVDLVELPPEQVEQARSLSNLRLYQFPDNGFTFIALNLASPNSPQQGQAADGSLLDQGVHPILGDLRVRRAMAHGLDYEQIVGDLYMGQGVRLASYILQKAPWAYANDLPMYEFDPKVAIALLESAGWAERNGSGIRVKDGQPLQLTLLTNRNNLQRVQLTQLAQQMLAGIGIDIQVDVVDFENMSERLLAQQYDMALLSWENVSLDPGHSTFWHSREDTPGFGYNFVSFQDAEVNQWLDLAQQAPNCDKESRSRYYQQIQHRVYEELPYIFLKGNLSTWAVANHWQGLEPTPWDFDHNVHLWWESK